MPRDPGTGIYNYPDGTRGISGQTIYSGRYNTFIDDLSTTMNAPLPVNMGGTGASSAMNARTNLQTEVASAGQVVANFDAQVWQSGSFTCATSTTAAPTANSFFGNAFLNGTDQNNLVLEATDITTGTIYRRRKVAGVWQGTAPYWKIAGSDDFVNVTGDAMTGALGINVAHTTPMLQLSGVGATNPNKTFRIDPTGTLQIINHAYTAAVFTLSDTGILAISNTLNVGGDINIKYGATAGTLYFGNTGTKYLQNDGTNWSMAGGSNIFLMGDVWSNKGTQGVYQFGNTATKYLIYDGANYRLFGGHFIVNAGSATATVYFGNTDTKYLVWDGTNFIFSGGPLYSNGRFLANSGKAVSLNDPQPAWTVWGSGQPNAYCMFATSSNLLAWGTANSDGTPTSSVMRMDNAGNFDASGTITSGSSFISNGAQGVTINGTSGSNPIVQYMVNGNPSFQQMFIQAVHVPGATVYWQFNCGSQYYHLGANTSYANKVGGGPWGDVSDARIKNVIGNYEHGLDEILQLNPVRYTFKGNDTLVPPSMVKDGEEVPEELKKMAPKVPYANSIHAGPAEAGTEFIGLVAQEAEIPMPEMVIRKKGYIDGVEVDDLRDLDTAALVFALVNAVKTLAARVEALEAS